MMKNEINALIQSRPFHQWLGLEVTDVGEGHVEITAQWRPEWIVNPEGNYIHGGILASLVDLGADWRFSPIPDAGFRRLTCASIITLRQGETCE